MLVINIQIRYNKTAMLIGCEKTFELKYPPFIILNNNMKSNNNMNISEGSDKLNDNFG
jgi:hypothetical protein